MIEREPADHPDQLGQAVVRHALVDRLTVARGWSQLLASFPSEEWLGHEEILRKGLARIDVATAHMTELLGHAASSSSPPRQPDLSGVGSPPPLTTR